MESEKVKEIKNNIIICSTKIECKGCSLFSNMKSTNCRNKLLADALTLINELESENERLKWEKQTLENNDTLLAKVGEMVQENQQLKDRISELEKEKKDYYDRLNNLQTYIDNHEEIWKGNTNNALKQFAERLKEHPTMKIYSLHNACERIPKAIDETLKEYEK